MGKHDKIEKQIQAIVIAENLDSNLSTNVL